MSNEELIKLINMINYELVTKYKIDIKGKKYLEKLAQRGVIETDVNLLDNKQLFTYCNALTDFKGKLEDAISSKKTNNDNKQSVSASQN